MGQQKHILPVIVLSQFAGTSIWFVGNALLPELKQSLHLSQHAVSLVTAAVMLGFVAGTLTFSIFSLADRFSPSKLFFISSILGALSNASIILLAHDGNSLFLIRFITGFFIAGIYPVGMKIAADWYKDGLGKAMGYLLGALVLGTAFPHLLRNRQFDLPWKDVLYFTSLFAVAGGIMMLVLGDGPNHKSSGKFQWNAIPVIFRSREWKNAAFGYFGHMWELYTFWGFLPVILTLYATKNNISMNIPLFSFLGIAVGVFSCIAGGYLSKSWGSNMVARTALYISGSCCFISPFIFHWPLILFLLLIFIWGSSVVPDSPQFSTLVSQNSPPELRGTALTIYNSIGFTISSISLFVIDHLHHSTGFFGGENTFLLLGFGMVFGNLFIKALWKA